MKIKQFTFFLSVSVLFALTASSEELAYKESTRGNYLYLNPFAHKPETPVEHLEYAASLRERGKLGSARKQYEILVKRWPESAEAAGALQAVGDICFEQREYKKSFETYEELIQKYYTGLRNYDSVLENQYAIAKREMERKRMRWMFGGYKAPERAIPYLESILRNAPQWEKAPEIQYQIGEAYRKNRAFEEAVGAYSIVEYRYPDSPVAEQAALSKIHSLGEMVEDTPYSVDIREDAQLAAELFAEIYPESEHMLEVDRFADDLAEQDARHDFEVGQFYERVPRPARNKAACIYYESVVKEYPETASAASAADRLRVLLPMVDEAIAAIERIPGAGRGPRGPLPERTATDPDAVEVTADQLEYEGDLLIGKGNVAVQQEGASLQADYVSVNRETGEIIAQGDVLMLRGEDRWEGEKLVYNFKTREGSFGPSSMHFDPVYIVAEKTEQVSSNEYRLVNARMTTCSGDDPAVYIKAKEVTLIDEGEPKGILVKARHVTFYAADVPVFYVPYWQRHLEENIFTYTVGYSGRLGAFLMTTATFRPTDWLRTDTHLDYYTARGLGLGQDFTWTTPNGEGHLKGYYINDRDPGEDDDLTADELALIDSRRYRVHLDHKEQFSDETYFRTEVNYLSDPVVLDDFFDDEFRDNVNPENYAVVQHSTDEYAAGVRVDHRLNDFYSTVERMPEGSFSLYRRTVGEYLYFQSDNRAGYYDMLYADYDTSLPGNYSSGRVDSYNQLFAPMRINDFFNIIPRAAYRGTWYSDSPAGEGEFRNIFEGGALGSFKMHKELTDKSGFYGTGLRHVAEPYVEYLYRNSSVETNDLYQFDEIDELVNRNEVRFGLRNFLQTKRGAKRIENVLDADVYTAYRFDREPGEDVMALLGADVELSLTDRISIQSDLEYSLQGGTFERFNARANYLANDSSRYWFEYRYLTDTRALLTTGTELFPNDDWSYQFLIRYDAELDEWRERRFMVNHRFDCIGLGVGVKVDEDDMPSLWLNLWLNAFGPGKQADRL